jgi:hypothetical protein
VYVEGKDGIVQIDVALIDRKRRAYVQWTDLIRSSVLPPLFIWERLLALAPSFVRAIRHML